MSEEADIRKLPPFEHSIGAVLIEAKETVLAPMRPKLREYLVTEPQWRVMRIINDRGATHATGLSEGGLLHAPSVTRILKELERREYVVRVQAEGDRRRKFVSLTPKGRQVVNAISRDILLAMSEYEESFGAERLNRLLDELRALSAAIKGKDRHAQNLYQP